MPRRNTPSRRWNGSFPAPSPAWTAPICGPAADIRDIAHRVIRCLLGLKTPDPLAARSGILVSDELLPSEVLALDRRKLLGLVTRRGSVDSHTAMLLRLMKIPGLAEVEISSQDEGHAALLDGFSHSLYLDPEPQLMERRPLAASL